MAAPTNRATFVEYVKRRLGEPVIEVNVDPDQIEDRVDDALQMFREFHYDAMKRSYLQHEITDSDVANGYIPVSDSVLYVTKVFPIASSSLTRDFFDIKYQIRLNDLATLTQFMGDLAYYEQMQQYLSLLDMKLNGTPQTHFSYSEQRLYIFGDLSDKDLEAGDYLVAETFTAIDPATNARIWDDRWLKAYATALVKQQWGLNLIKFEGMQLPGGVMLNGRQMFDDANAEIERLLEDLRSEHEEPVDFFVG